MAQSSTWKASSIFGEFRVPALAGKATIESLSKARAANEVGGVPAPTRLGGVVLEARSSKVSDIPPGPRIYDLDVFGTYFKFDLAEPKRISPHQVDGEHWYFYNWAGTESPDFVYAFSHQLDPLLNDRLIRLQDGLYYGTDGAPWSTVVVPPLIRLRPSSVLEAGQRCARVLQDAPDMMPLLSDFCVAVSDLAMYLRARKEEAQRDGHAPRVVEFPRSILRRLLFGFEMVDAQMAKGRWLQELYPVRPWDVATKMLTIMLRSRYDANLA